MQLKCAPPPPELSGAMLKTAPLSGAHRSRKKPRRAKPVKPQKLLKFEPWSRLLEGPGSLSFTPIALARRRCNVLFAMPRDGDLLPPPVAPKTAG